MVRIAALIGVVLVTSVGVVGCGDTAGETRVDAETLARCGARGSPVTLSQLVEVFREHEVTLSIDEDTCAASDEEREQAALSDASNGGPSGLEDLPEIKEAEGTVVCSVFPSGKPRADVYVVKFPGDTETRLSVLNVDCVILPYSRSSEAAQVERLRKALAALANEVP